MYNRYSLLREYFMIKLAVFLGNPGRQYSLTRHNFGWLCLENISLFSGLDWKDKFKGKWAQLHGEKEKIILLKPETFMNKSGESISAAGTFFKISMEEILIIHDDIELDFGKWQLRKGGGLGGHNGLRSAKTCLGGSGFYRLRLGIGRPSRGEVSAHVLGRFSREEEAELELVYQAAEQVLRETFSKGPDKIPGNLIKGSIY